MRPKKQETRTERISCRVTKQEKGEIEDFATEQELSVGQVLRKAVKLYIKGLLDDYDVGQFDD